MTNPIIMNEDDRVKFERGCAMLKRLHDGNGFDDHWVPVGEGLLAVRRTVLAVLRLTQGPRRPLQQCLRSDVYRNPIRKDG